MWYGILSLGENKCRYLPTIEGSIMKKIIKFKKDGLIGLHFFMENMNYTVVAASYNEWEKQQLSYLESDYRSKDFTTTSLCLWCIRHHIQYQIVYPVTVISVFKNPYKYIKFLELKRKLKEPVLLPL